MRSVTMFLGVELGERLLLSLNKLINILETRWGNVSGGGQHDSVKELNMGLQLVSVGVAFPVEIHHDSGLLDIGDELLVLLDEGVKLSELSVFLFLGALSHQNLQDLLEPFPDFSSLEVFAERLDGRNYYLIQQKVSGLLTLNVSL